MAHSAVSLVQNTLDATSEEANDRCRPLELIVQRGSQPSQPILSLTDCSSKQHYAIAVEEIAMKERERERPIIGAIKPARPKKSAK